MGLFDLPAPLFGAIDGVLAMALPAFLRLLLWGILAGWVTMLVYRRLSNQEKIGALKAQQKEAQKQISAFDGEFEELMPLIKDTLGLGVRQLGLALGPALLSSLPVLFLIIWVAGQFGHTAPEPGDQLLISPAPATSVETMNWAPQGSASESDNGWLVTWPESGQSLSLSEGQEELLTLPLTDNIPVIHKKKWWNFLMANPIGYLPDDAAVDVLEIDLPAIAIQPFGPGWMHGWMFTFFMSFLFSSIGFKFILKID